MVLCKTKELYINCTNMYMPTTYTADTKLSMYLVLLAAFAIQYSEGILPSNYLVHGQEAYCDFMFFSL